MGKAKRIEKPYITANRRDKGMIYVIKKDGTREEFDPQKIVKAVNKSAARILYKFSDEDIKRFQEIIESTAHLILEFSQEGGLENASGF